MKVIEVNEYGEPDVLAEAERPEPVPAGGQVRVRVSATTVNPADLWARAGLFSAALPGVTPPLVLGWDFAGVLLDPAPGLAAGQAVAGLYPWFANATGTGTYTEVLLADPAWLAPLPDGADPAQAATIAMNGQTSVQALGFLGLQPGQTLLVTGASGTVGGLAVQLAAAAGAHVIAVASSGDEEWVRSLGAKEVLGRLANAEVARAVRELVPDGVDAALDAVAGGPDLIGAVRDGGRYVAVTGPSQPAPERGIAITAARAEPDREHLEGLLGQLASGQLRTRIAGTLPLAQAAQAHRRVAAGGLRGKLVLVP